MKKLSLKRKILFIFSIPALALIYFSIASIKHEYNKLDETQTFKQSVEMTQVFSELIHNIQIERGLSAGYIDTVNKAQYKQALLSQHKRTDISYKKFLNKITDTDKTKARLYDRIGVRITPLTKEILALLHNIKSIRKNVLRSQINFQKEIEYYTKINSKLIIAIKIFNSLAHNLKIDTTAVIKLEEIKEYSGLERAYIYNQLLSEKDHILDIKKLQIKQKNAIDQFFIDASLESIKVYNSHFSPKTEEALHFCREGIVKKSLGQSDASFCFNASTKYIEMFNKISNLLFINYYNNADSIHMKALQSLYTTHFIWIVSLISLLFLSFILKSSLDTEEKNKEDLIIASYAFNAHEAMTVTDMDGVIIQVNNAFSKITGYSQEEAIGQHTRILRSNTHNTEFYKHMWDALINKGVWYGEIYNKRKNGEIYPERLSITAIKNDEYITTHYIAQFLDITEIKEAQERLQHQADHDFLTNLLNRKSLMQRLNEEYNKALRHKFTHAFLFIDIDNFKLVNDSYGHSVGDALIVEVSSRISQLLREEDIFARISGDEFGIMILNLSDDMEIASAFIRDISNKILSTISKEFLIKNISVQIGVSIGIKIFPDGEKNIQDIMVHADTAMYQAKHQGRNQFVFFDKDIEARLIQFSSLEQEIKRGLLNEEFELFYQPKVDVSNSNIIGAELLMRWRHPEKGILFPDSFLEVTNKLDLIYEFTTLSIKSACIFIDKHKNFKGTLAINISSKELLNSNFEEKITSIIMKKGIDPSRIEIEITEDDLIQDFEIVVEKIKRLQEFGIKFSIDDFGTGYSSITYLQKLPVNSMKIDKIFMLNLLQNNNKELVRMMIGIAKVFNMEVIVEGIEDKYQLDFINDLGAQSYQGFLFSKAIDEDSFIKLLNS